MQAQHFCFTLFNYESLLDSLRLLIDNSKVTYLLWGEEVCPNTNAKHLQGYVQLKSRMRMLSLKKLIGIETIHLTACAGSDEDNEKYCTKENTNIIRLGTRRSIKSRKRKSGECFGELIGAVESGWSLQEIVKEWPEMYVKHHTGVEKVLKLFNETVPTVYYGPFQWNFSPNFEKSIIIMGPTGLGKTQYAKTLFTNVHMIRHIDKLKGFNQLHHGGIIFDDMEFSHWPVSSQIHLCDQTDDADINVKYGYVTIPARTKKIFTCNPERFPFTKDSAIMRRLEVWAWNGHDFYLKL